MFKLIPGFNQKSILSACISLICFSALLGQDVPPVSEPLKRDPSSANNEISVGFQLLEASETGVDFQNRLPTNLAAVNQILLNGSGVAVGDFDNDGLDDLYFCQLVGPNALYKNLGNFRFQDVAGKLSVDLPRQFSTGALFEDFNGDGWLDLVVNGIQAGSKLFLNDGQGGFVLAEDSGLEKSTAAHSMAAADFDRDGDLDLYVTHYRNDTVRDRPIRVPLRNENGTIIIPEPYDERFDLLIDGPGQGSLIELGTADLLYENIGPGKFRPVSWTQGKFKDVNGSALKKDPLDWGLAVAFRDINQDGWPDLYVCNDFTSPDRIWINQQDGSFRALDPKALSKTSWASMAIDFSDINRDGLDDFFVADMLSPDPIRRLTQTGNMSRPVTEYDRLINRPQIMRNTLQWNLGNGLYAEVAPWSGVAASEWTWSGIFCDVDLDGYEDLLIANGHGFDILDADAVLAVGEANDANNNRRRRTPMELYPDLKVPNLIFKNRGSGQFKSIGNEWGWTHPSVTHGMALVDLDQDGDMDIVGNNLNQSAFVYKNIASQARIKIQLKGTLGNPRAIGSRLIFKTPEGIQSDEIQSGGAYLSGSTTDKTFAIPGSDSGFLNHELTIHWPDGSISQYKDIQPNTKLTVTKPTTSSVTKQGTQPRISEVATDPEFNWSYQLQPNPKFSSGEPWSTRPNNIPAAPFDGLKNSTIPNGSRVWICDWNQDNWPDIGSLHSDPLHPGFVIWVNQQGKGFTPTTIPVPAMDSEWNQISLVLLNKTPNGINGLIALQSASNPDQTLWISQQFGSGSANENIQRMAFKSNGKPGPFAELILQNGNAFKIITTQDPQSIQPDQFYIYLPEDSVQTAGIFPLSLDTPIHSSTSIKMAAQPDATQFHLIIASPWSPVRIYEFNTNSRTNPSEPYTAKHLKDLDTTSGWWNGITLLPPTASSNSTSFIAWNWGSNLDWNVYDPKTIVRLVGQLPGSSRQLTLTGYQTAESQYKTFLWDTWNEIQMQWPRFATAYPTVKEFAESSLEAVGTQLKAQGIQWTRLLKSKTSAHQIINANKKETSPALPSELNWSPIFSAEPWKLSNKAKPENTEIYFLTTGHQLGWMDPPRQDSLPTITGIYLDQKEWKTIHFKNDLPNSTEPPTAILPADFNNDGKPDLVIVRPNGDIQWLIAH